jgi:glycine cleavage system H protein
VNESPYENGWMVKIKASDLSQIDDLMDASAYKSLIGQ